MRLLLDTNTIISGLFWDGTPEELYQIAVSEPHTLVTSNVLLAELEGVLGRAKVAPALQMTGQSVAEIVMRHGELVEIAEPVEIAPNVVRDPKDRAVLACVIGGEVDMIVSGDKDLLVLNNFQHIPIVTAQQGLLRLREPNSPE